MHTTCINYYDEETGVGLIPTFNSFFIHEIIKLFYYSNNKI